MKKSSRVILDAGPVISLALVGKLEILSRIFNEIMIPEAVWEETTRCKTFPEIPQITSFFKNRIKKIVTTNDLISVMGRGESEAVLLYRELNADFLVIDDKRARFIAEESGVNCIGTLAVLMKAKEKGLEKELRPLFIKLLENKRYFKIDDLNQILLLFNEQKLD